MEPTAVRRCNANLVAPSLTYRGPSGMTVRELRNQSGVKGTAPGIKGHRQQRQEGRGQITGKHAQQDKRPRHVCAAKSLSAHPFFQHAPRMEACRRVANRIKALNI
jgi:hypothetical protein